MVQSAMPVRIARHDRRCTELADVHDTTSPVWPVRRRLQRGYGVVAVGFPDPDPCRLTLAELTIMPDHVVGGTSTQLRRLDSSADSAWWSWWSSS
jgi:hypothetical protein